MSRRRLILTVVFALAFALLLLASGVPLWAEPTTEAPLRIMSRHVGMLGHPSRPQEVGQPEARRLPRRRREAQAAEHVEEHLRALLAAPPG